jgi:hypothetical protein
VQDAIAAKDWTAAQHALPTAQAAVTSQDGRYALGRFQLEVGLGLQSVPLQLQGLDSLVASGKVPAANLPDIYRNRGILAGQAGDPAKRTALMREHYETMYRDMQTIRGMEWMWGPNGRTPLPEADSPAAKLYIGYCRQCHSPPSPTLHTRTEWRQTLQRMRGHIAAQSGPLDTGVLVPSAEEFEALSQYLDDHAAEEP